ncbi:HlyD family efflux transporter periplasmic adaptor subunit [Stenotrophomonas sp. GD03930]|uniref:HlyD family secretion protein n=1 Tax=Stenotrophomonas TaxID=40323 RepID=UPI0015DDC9D2|nr:MULTISPECIES: HlyD family efflux transporter periplasmic adaptor subunit [Stenotrophomonas]MBA0434577.1 HlyD family efflux transporter periplasmic adaptor subunit [Stenotrophomonas maltophilia]MDH1231389.1 HlyD family efflux transporter periplasmic adaptor subunit [Stenotrophomonas sp. GD03930]MDZ5814203.1 HlyD family efflux transporter periplasmic adaptor subunit [Stenotrophomonas maltophilia]
MELFRKEAETAHADQFGAVIVSTPKAHFAAGVSATALCLAALVLSFHAHYARREQVSGHLVTDTGESRILARRSATVSEVYVREHQHVRKGDPILRLSSEMHTRGGAVHARVEENIENQITSVHASVAATEAALISEQHQLRERVKSLLAQASDLRQQIGYQQQAAEQKQRTLTKLRPLLKDGFVAEYQVQDLESALLDTRAQTSGLHRQLEDISQQQRETSRKLTSLEIDSELKLNDLRREQARLRTSLAQDQSELELVVRAQSDALVSSVLVQPENYVEPGQPIASLIPTPTTLKAEIFIPSTAIGFVHRGTKVAMHYAAFPYQKYGVQYGVVEQVSETPTQPAQLSALLGQQPPAQPMYRAIASLERQQIVTDGQQRALVPGMQLEAALLLEDRSIIAWLLEPITAFRASIQD